MKARRPCSASFGALGPSLALASLGALARADEAEMGPRVQDLLRAHQADVYGCVQAAPRPPQGAMLLRVVVGEGGRPAQVEVLKDEAGAPELGRCLVDKVRTWELRGLAAAAGDQVVFPLAFRPEPGEAPRPSVAVPTAAGPPPRGLIAAADQPELVRGRITVRRLVDAGLLGTAPQASLTRLTLAPSARLAEHVHDAAEAIYVLEGMVRVRQGKRQLAALKPGDVAFLPAGAPHALEAAPLAPARVLQIFAPSGPADAYQDAAAPGTRPARPSDPLLGPKIVSGEAAPALALPRGTGKVKLLLDGTGAPFALDLLVAEQGTVPPHVHEGSDELLLVLEGRGETTLDGQAVKTGPGDALRIAAGVRHGLTVLEPIRALQVYAPGGPEQRFKAAPTAPPPQPLHLPARSSSPGPAR